MAEMSEEQKQQVAAMDNSANEYSLERAGQVDNKLSASSGSGNGKWGLFGTWSSAAARWSTSARCAMLHSPLNRSDVFSPPLTLPFSGSGHGRSPCVGLVLVLLF